MTAKRSADPVFASGAPEVTERLAAGLATALRRGDVLALSGPLGSGKTRFVLGLARGLGVAGRVRSPSFGLVHEYSGRVLLIHADLYRVAETEVDGLGLEEMLERGALAVEWGEKLPPRLRADALRLRFEIVSEQVRSIAASASGPRGGELFEEWRRRVGEETRS